jgi:hypothetical protein
VADERDEDRERQNDLLFRGTVARGEVFDSLDAIGALDDGAPAGSARGAPSSPAPSSPEPPASVPAAEDPPREPVAAHPRPSAGAEPSPSTASGPSTRPRAGSRPARPPAVDDQAASVRRRVLVVVTTVLAIAGTFLVVFPFDVSSGGVTARCGPPVFEVVVPSDAAFDVPENTLCGSPAQHRLIVGVLLLVAFLGIALAHQWSVRGPGRRARKARRARAHAAKHGTTPSSGQRRAPPASAEAPRATAAPR